LLLILAGQRALRVWFIIRVLWALSSVFWGGFLHDGVEIVGPAVRELRWLFHRTFPKQPIMLPVLPEEAGDCPVKVLAPELGQHRRDIYDSYVNAFARASNNITITNSYFIPPGRVRRALARAVARGVIVRVIVPRLSDVKIVQLASRALYEHLLSQNIQIFEWEGGVLHAKTAAVDDSWCTVGTFNFDALSIHQNLEVNVAMESPEVTRMLRERIGRDLATSRPVDLAVFKKRSWLTKLVERVCFAFRFLL
jgi:cardiolipin synthase